MVESADCTYHATQAINCDVTADVSASVRVGILRMAEERLRVDVAENCMRVIDLTVREGAVFQRLLPGDEENPGGGWVLESTLSQDEINAHDADWPRRELVEFVAKCVPCDTVAILGDDVSKIMKYAADRWKGHDVRVIAIADKVALSRLIGHQGLPFTIMPGTQEILWHRDINYHKRCGRIVLVAAVTDADADSAASAPKPKRRTT